MAKVRIDSNVSIYPMPVVLAGAMVGGKANFLAIGWVARVNYQPPMVAMSLSKGHYTIDSCLNNGTSVLSHV